MNITATARSMRREPQPPPEPDWSRELLAGFSRGQLSNLHGALDQAIRDLIRENGPGELLQEMIELKQAVYARARNYSHG
jgi:hypothetical protein